MLHRIDAEGVLGISQPAHAWVAGQLARAWGNAEFGDFAPAEEVCLAAEQHDVGFLEWEQAPTVNPATGLPHTFMDLPTGLHLDIWSRSIRQVLRFGRYPALLVSLHFTHLRKRQALYNSPDGTEREREFLDAQAALQRDLLASLAACSRYAPFCAQPVLERNRLLLAAWDYLSLVLCMGLAKEQRIPGVPAREGLVELRLRPLDPPRRQVAVHPWPFRTGRLSLICEGLLLAHSAKGAVEQPGAYQALELTLHPESNPAK